MFKVIRCTAIDATRREEPIFIEHWYCSRNPQTFSVLSSSHETLNRHSQSTDYGSGVVWSISYSTHFIFTITLWGTSHYHPCFIEEEMETHHWPINSLPFDNIICHSHYNNVLKTLAGWPLLVLPFLCLSFLLCKRGLESYLLHRVACGGNEFIRVSLLIQCLRQNQYFLLLYFFFILLPLKTRPLQ